MRNWQTYIPEHEILAREDKNLKDQYIHLTNYKCFSIYTANLQRTLGTYLEHFHWKKSAPVTLMSSKIRCNYVPLWKKKVFRKCTESVMLQILVTSNFRTHLSPDWEHVIGNIYWPTCEIVSIFGGLNKEKGGMITTNVDFRTIITWNKLQF